MTTTNAYTTSIDFSGNKIAFDISHGGFHTTEADLAPIIGNLTAAGNEVIFINETWGIPDDVDALFLTQPELMYTATQLADIYCWFHGGDKLLWISGDSDFGGYFNPWSSNAVLEQLGAIVRFAGVSIEDPDNNDGSAYRVAATEIGVGDAVYDDLAIELTTGMDAGVIFHGPTAIMAHNGYDYRDLRYGKSVFPLRVKVIMTYSGSAIALDSDTSDGVLDYYANVTGDITKEGFYPAICYENVTELGSHIIVSGESIYTNYKFMYGQNTEQGEYNDGTHYGQLLVNNILNYFLETPPDATSYAFALLPLAVIGVIYAVSRRKK